MEWPHPREHYRILYPTSVRPRLISGEYERDVVDVSEQGMRVRLAENEMMEAGEPVEGIIRFRRGPDVKVAGTVVRVEGRDAAVHLDAGVPLKIIIEEQRYLREFHRGSAW
ncbi:MAG: PilZ domain-containing protein [Gemmatimonadales bacterium]